MYLDVELHRGPRSLCGARCAKLGAIPVVQCHPSLGREFRRRGSGMWASLRLRAEEERIRFEGGALRGRSVLPELVLQCVRFGLLASKYKFGGWTIVASPTSTSEMAA
jgi:hypothetical protein